MNWIHTYQLFWRPCTYSSSVPRRRWRSESKSLSSSYVLNTKRLIDSSRRPHNHYHRHSVSIISISYLLILFKDVCMCSSSSSSSSEEGSLYQVAWQLACRGVYQLTAEANCPICIKYVIIMSSSIIIHTVRVSLISLDILFLFNLFWIR